MDQILQHLLQQCFNSSQTETVEVNRPFKTGGPLPQAVSYPIRVTICACLSVCPFDVSSPFNRQMNERTKECPFHLHLHFENVCFPCSPPCEGRFPQTLYSEQNRDGTCDQDRFLIGSTILFLSSSSCFLDPLLHLLLLISSFLPSQVSITSLSHYVCVCVCVSLSLQAQLKRLKLTTQPSHHKQLSQTNQSIFP